MVCGILKGFSIERLIALLVTLDYRVSIHIEGKDHPLEEIGVAGEYYQSPPLAQ